MFLAVSTICLCNVDQISIKITPVDEDNSERILPNAKVTLLVGRKVEIENGKILQIPEGPLLIEAEQIRSIKNNTCEVIHYYLKEADEVDDNNSSVFFFESFDSIVSLYYKATAEGYFPTFRKALPGPGTGLVKGDIYPVAALLSKKSEDHIISRFQKTMEFKSPFSKEKSDPPSMIVSIPENSVSKATKCYIKQILSSAVSMPLEFHSMIESPALLIYPYDLEFEKPIQIKAKPLRTLPEKNAQYVYSIIRLVPGEYGCKLLSEEPAKSSIINNNEYIEYNVQKGGMYYAIMWTPRNKGKDAK